MKRVTFCAFACMTAIGCASTQDGVEMPFPSSIPPAYHEQPTPVEPVKAKRAIPVRRVKHGAAIFGYDADRVYDVSVTVGRATVFQLAEGESFKGTTLVGNAGPKDNPKWDIVETASGTRALVAVRAIEPGLSTNLIIPGTRHTYVVNITSVGKPTSSIVRWDYPDDEIAGRAEAIAKPAITLSPFDPSAIYRNFRLSGDRPAWTPVSVFEHGERSFIEFPGPPGRIGAPALFAVEENGAAKPVQFLITGNFYEFSTRFQVAELRGNGATVKITRGN